MPHMEPGGQSHFYPRSPCGERQVLLDKYFREGAFLSTLSLRRATSEVPEDQYTALSISIHALLAESDVYLARVPAKANNFYPRSPCGERQTCITSRPKATYFYPRSPCGERPITDIDFRIIAKISIHALLAESDEKSLVVSRPLRISIHALLAESDGARISVSFRGHNFYPRSPCGERRSSCHRAADPRNFYPRSPCGERLSPLLA